jgi:ferredoxin
MTLTLAVKNMFGAVVGAAKPGWHLQAKEQTRFADMLIDLWRALPPQLSILDGVTAMEGNGPGSGDPFPLGLVIASPSALALDQVAGEVAGVGPDRHPVLYRARERELAGSRPGDVEVHGVQVDEVRRPFSLPKSISRVDFNLPPWVNRRLKYSLNSYPELDPAKCTTCGECAKICPVNAITLHNKEQGGGIVDRDLCINCFCCQEICPERAIGIVPGRLLRLFKIIGAA